MKLDKIVPFGRMLDEYRRIFTLTGEDLRKRIVGVGDGPSSFNAEMRESGNTVISVDPLYRLGSEEIERQFYAVVDDIIAQMKATPEDWVWSYHASPGHLREKREGALRKFLDDYDRGKLEGRYIAGELPGLGFEDEAFELALCSHFLFLYSDHLSYDFHRSSIIEMLRVAREVRIFPIITLMLDESPYLRPVITELETDGFIVSVEKVDYELQKGGRQMLRIKKSARTP